MIESLGIFLLRGLTVKKKVFLSDNDGTLTVARKPIRGEMAETIVEFSKRFKFAIVTGSPWHDMEEQMPPEILTNPNIDYWCNMVFFHPLLIFGISHSELVKIIVHPTIE